MPLRRNQCKVCGYRFRTLESHEPSEGVACPACGSEETQRLLPRVAVQFKGSGYYKTDHARRQNGAAGSTTAEKEPTASSAED